MKNKRLLRNILSSLCFILVMTAIIMVLNVAKEGMWLFEKAIREVAMFEE